MGSYLPSNAAAPVRSWSSSRIQKPWFRTNDCKFTAHNKHFSLGKLQIKKFLVIALISCDLPRTQIIMRACISKVGDCSTSANNRSYMFSIDMGIHWWNILYLLVLIAKSHPLTPISVSFWSNLYLTHADEILSVYLWETHNLPQYPQVFAQFLYIHLDQSGSSQNISFHLRHSCVAVTSSHSPVQINI